MAVIGSIHLIICIALTLKNTYIRNFNDDNYVKIDVE